MRLGTRSRLLAILGVAPILSAIATCTFPDVTYDTRDGGSGGNGCDVTAVQCINQVSSCVMPADTALDKCQMTCGQANKPTCAECEQDHAGALDECALACEACVLTRQGCHAAESCQNLVGF